MMPQLMQRIGIPFVLLCLATFYFMEVRGGKAQDIMLIGPVYYLMVVLFFINAATDLRDILRQEHEAQIKRRMDAALAAGDAPLYQSLTRELAALKRPQPRESVD